MGRKSNVNPDHYKTAGREPQGQSILHEVERQKLKEVKARLSPVVAGPAPVPRRKKTLANSAAAKPLAEREKMRRKGSGKGA